MEQAYAGMLGLTAFVTMMARGLIGGSGVEGTVQLALMAMFGMAAAGYLLGKVAEQTVDESVKNRMNAELAALEAERASQEKSAVRK